MLKAYLKLLWHEYCTDSFGMAASFLHVYKMGPTYSQYDIIQV